MSTATRVMERCEFLGQVSEAPDLLFRFYGSQAMRRANELVGYWMRAAGMSVRRDEIGNLIGRYEARDKNAGTLVLGSHLDTVRDAGKYDGPLGVMVALACVERLHLRNERLPFAIEVVGFADEEGVRFGTTYLGSSVYAGIFDEELLSARDPDGVTMADAVRSFGGDPDALAGCDGSDLLGYCEVHIEQGPVLEKLDLPVGVVAAITGESSVKIEFVGEAGHAGTVPMKERRDALCAAAEFVLAAEETARSEPGTVATVGHISVRPSAHNVIPGSAHLGLDLRHQNDAVRERVLQRLHQKTEEIATSRGVEYHWRVKQENRAAPTDPRLTALLARAVEELGYPVEHLPSGAGHDAAAVAEIAPIAMLFVRCRGGISHNPAESVEPEDVAVAIDVVSRFLELVAESGDRAGPSQGS
jgi:allantoate deiminase